MTATITNLAPVQWAFAQGKRVYGYEPPAFTLVLVAYATLAVEGLYDGNGYNGNTPGQVAYATGLSESTVRKYTRSAASRGLLVDYGRVFRIPEAAWNGA